MAKKLTRATTVRVFDTKVAADQAVADFRAAGYRDDQIGLIYRNTSGKSVRTDGAGENNAAEGAVAGATAGGLLGALTGAGVPREDAEVYSEAVRRGGTLVTVRADDRDASRVEAILARHSPIDPVSRRADYRRAGWTGYDPNAEPYELSQAERERIRTPYPR